MQPISAGYQMILNAAHPMIGVSRTVKVTTPRALQPSQLHRKLETNFLRPNRATNGNTTAAHPINVKSPVHSADTPTSDVLPDVTSCLATRPINGSAQLTLMAIKLAGMGFMFCLAFPMNHRLAAIGSIASI